MYERTTIGLEEANKAVQAIISYVNKEQLLPVAIAVVDDHGDLVQFVRMDRVSLNAAHMAITKAYTAAKLRRDTSKLTEVYPQLDVANLADNRLTRLTGGVCIPGGTMALWSVVGAIGVGGLPISEDDEKLARIGVEAISS